MLSNLALERVICLCKLGFYGGGCQFKNYTSDRLANLNSNLSCFDATCNDYKQLEKEYLIMSASVFIIYNELYNAASQIKALQGEENKTYFLSFFIKSLCSGFLEKQVKMNSIMSQAIMSGRERFRKLLQAHI